MSHHEHQRSDAEQPDLPSRKEPTIVWVFPVLALVLLVATIVIIVSTA